MRVRGQAERRVGEREDRAAVAAAVEVEVARVDRHRHFRRARAAGAQGDAERRAEAVAGDERRRCARASRRRRGSRAARRLAPAHASGVDAARARRRLRAARRPTPTASRCASSAASSSSRPVRASALTTTTRGATRRRWRARRSVSISRISRAVCCGERQVALADGEDVGDLERAGLDRLHVVAEAGRADDDARVGERDDAPSPTGRCRRSRR